MTDCFILLRAGNYTKDLKKKTSRMCTRTRSCGIYILHHLGFRVRIVLDRGAVDPLPMLNIPGVEGLKVGVVPDTPKLMVGAAGAVKLNPVAAANNTIVICHKIL